MSQQSHMISHMISHMTNHMISHMVYTSVHVVRYETVAIELRTLVIVRLFLSLCCFSSS